MEVGNGLDELDSVQFSVFIQIVHVEVMELQLFWGHVCGRIDFSIKMFLYVAR